MSLDSIIRSVLRYMDRRGMLSDLKAKYHSEESEGGANGKARRDRRNSSKGKKRR